MQKELSFGTRILWADNIRMHGTSDGDGRSKRRLLHFPMTCRSQYRTVWHFYPRTRLLDYFFEVFIERRILMPANRDRHNYVSKSPGLRCAGTRATRLFNRRSELRGFKHHSSSVSSFWPMNGRMFALSRLMLKRFYVQLEPWRAWGSRKFLIDAIFSCWNQKKNVEPRVIKDTAEQCVLSFWN